MISRMKEGLGTLRKKDSPLEAQLKEATSRENWGVPNTTLQAIAQATSNMEDCDLIMSFLWKILQEKKDKEWRRVVKTLSLIEMIVKHGSERAIQEVRRDAWRIQQWKEFRYMEEGKDVGSGIRFKAAAILEMLSDEELLKEEKEKAQKLQQKMTSMVAPGSEIKQEGGGSAFKSPFDKGRRAWRRKQPEESPQSSPTSPSGRLPQSDADMAAMVTQFMNVTNASRLVAKECLERSGWDMHQAVMQHLGAEGRPRDDKPGWTERKSRVDQVVSISKVSERQAEELLEKCQWNVEAALEKFFTETPSAPKPKPSGPSAAPKARAGRAPTPSSSSGSEESDSESEEEREAGKGGGKAGWPQSNGKGWESAAAWPGGDNGAGGWPSAGPAQAPPSQAPPSQASGWPSKGASGFGKGSAGLGPAPDSFGSAPGWGSRDTGFGAEASGFAGAGGGAGGNPFGGGGGGSGGFGGGFGSQAPRAPFGGAQGFGKGAGSQGPAPGDAFGSAPGWGGSRSGFGDTGFGGPSTPRTAGGAGGNPFGGGGGGGGGGFGGGGFGSGVGSQAPRPPFGGGSPGFGKGVGSQGPAQGDAFGSAPGWGSARPGFGQSYGETGFGGQASTPRGAAAGNPFGGGGGGGGGFSGGFGSQAPRPAGPFGGQGVASNGWR